MQKIFYRNLQIVHWPRLARPVFPVFHYSEEQQIGENFGERFINAIQDIFNHGYQYIITVGNDTPELRTRHIHKALHQLFSGKTVLGPSVDGGFYLLGLEKSKFCADEFLALPWQTSSLRSSVIQLMCQKAVNVYCLQTLIDIDSVNDIQLLTKRTNNILFGIIKYLKLVFGYSLPSENIPHRKPSPIFHFPFYNKGSPAFSSST